MKDERPLHLQVRDRIADMAVDSPLGASAAIPPEPELASEMGVSRGTVRKAVDSLVAQGLLIREQGRGTFVNGAAHVRMVVFPRLEQVAMPDSRFDRDFDFFIPDYEGSDRCVDAIRRDPAYEAASRIFVTRDNNLRLLRQRALEDSKEVVVPSHALRTGFRLLSDVPSGMEPFAATLDGLDGYASVVPMDELATLAPIGLVVTGAVAATTDGSLLGATHDYFQIEVGVLATLGLIDDSVPIVAAVHDCQLVELAPDADLGAVVADLIVTPEHVYRPGPRGRRHRALSDSRIQRDLVDEVPGLRALLAPSGRRF